jgi:putative copper export protein
MTFLEPTARALLFISLALMLGMPLALRFIIAPILKRFLINEISLIQAIRRIVAFALLAFVVGSIALFIAQVLAFELGFTTFDEWVQFVGASLIGRITLARLAIGGLMWLALRSASGWAWASLVGACVAQATLTRTSHTWAMGANAINTLTDYVHLFSGALWLGGLVVLNVATKLAIAESDAPKIVAAMIRRFSPMGMIGVGLAGASGLALSALHVTDAQMIASFYGSMWLLKILFVAFAVALAAHHKFVTVNNLIVDDDVTRFVRSLRIETIIVAAVFVAAALMTSNSPSHNEIHEHHAEISNFSFALSTSAIVALCSTLIALALEWRKRFSQT